MSDPARSDLIATYNRWMANLALDASLVQDAAFDEELPREARRFLISGLDYLPRQFDIIPDHFPGVGSLDDAFVLRVSAMLAVRSGLGDLPVEKELELRRLSDDTDQIQALLGGSYPLLVAYAVRLPDLTMRNRNADSILDDAERRGQFLRELRDELAGRAPATIEDEAQLEQVRLFIRDKCTLGLATGAQQSG